MHNRIIWPLRFSLLLALALPAGACLRATITTEGAKLTLVVTSPAFKEGQAIPLKHTCDGEDVSPALNWSAVPENTLSVALICDDPDAPAGTWVHWVLYDLAPTSTGLPQGGASNWPSVTQGTNDFNRIGYGGPCPPPGKAHRYFFTLYALDTKLNLKPGTSKDELVSAMTNHILAEGQLMGTYQRK